MKFPFMKFYTRDWQADPELRLCSLEARGFWFECLCIMHNAKRRGFLESPNGKPLNDDDLARLMATFKGDVYRCKQELLEHGVPSVDEQSGVWYCRRMIKETAKSKKCADAGRRGGGSPSLSTNTGPDTRYQMPDARYHISLNVTFKGALKRLQENPTVENAVVCVYACHEAFRNVPGMHIENTLREQPDREKWIEAITGLAKKYAGAELKFPNRALSNWLAGKPTTERKSKLPEN